MPNTWYEDYWQHDTRVPVLNTATHRVSFEWPENVILDTLHQPPLFLTDESISPIGRTKPPYEWATVAVLVLGAVGMVAFWAWWGG